VKILIVSFYYPPDFGAGAFRAAALVRALDEQLPANAEIEVLTTVPHRYPGHVPDAPPIETQGRLKILRFALPSVKSGRCGLMLSYARFARSCNRHARGNPPDLVVATASRLFPAVIGARIAKRANRPLYLDIRDLFAANFCELHPGVHWAAVRGVLARLEARTLGQAARISVVSPAFVERLAPMGVRDRCRVFPNGIDDEFSPANPGVRASESHSAANSLRVTYAGNIGQGQALEAIIPQLAQRLGERVQFRIYGEGRRRDALEREICALGLKNVEIHAPVPRSTLPTIYQQADVLFLHLSPAPALQATIPSKLFEYAASGRPIWAGVSGISAGLLHSEVANSAVFPPGDVDAATKVLGRLAHESTPRSAFIKRYNRRTIMNAMAEDIVSLLM